MTPAPARTRHRVDDRSGCMPAAWLAGKATLRVHSVPSRTTGPSMKLFRTILLAAALLPLAGCESMLRVLFNDGHGLRSQIDVPKPVPADATRVS